MSCKIVLVGDSSVGKSSIVSWFVYNRLHMQNTPTIGAAFVTHQIRTSSGIVPVNIWDTAGQERFRSLVRMYYQKAVACICVFDVSNRSSFDNIAYWLHDFKRNADADYVILLVANKSDLDRDIPESMDLRSQDPRSLMESDIDALTSRLNLPIVYTSGLNGSGITEAFEAVAQMLIDSGIYQTQAIVEAETVPLQTLPTVRKCNC